MLAPATTRCNGKQTLRGVLAGICVACARRDDSQAGPQTPHMLAPAVREGGVWTCAERLPPAGG